MSKSLRALSDEPLNAAPRATDLTRSVITPTEVFFIRNHAPMPRAPSSITIDGLVEAPVELTDLSSLPRASVIATLQCAGNRRSELLALRDIPGELAWDACAIGTAVWEGVRLRDVLERAGLRDDAGHIELLGSDDTIKGDHRGGFGGSIPRAKALADEVLLADTMNGEPLPPEHGGPVRAVVPGYIGARSVKWLRRITARASPSDNPFHTGYSIVRDDAPPQVLGEFGVTSAILVPVREAIVAAGLVEVNGYACAGDGSGIASVEVSVGESCWTAELLGEDLPWAWRLWRADVDMAPGDHVVSARARARSGGTQPEAIEWNRKGYGNNAVHRVPLHAR